MLRPSAIARSFALLCPRMGRNAALVEKIIGLVNADGEANLAAVLRALYPDAEREPAQAKLRQLRAEIAKAAAKKPELKFALEGDSKTRSEPEQRTVWFFGEDLASELLHEFNAPNIQQVDPVFIPLEAIKQGPMECLVVYAAADQADAQALIAHLKPHCQKGDIRVWTEAEILPGEDRADQREQAAKRADVALLLISPHFEADTQTRKTVARLVELRKRMVPVQLHETADPHPQGPFRDAKGKTFDASPKKKAFALELFRTMRQRLGKELETCAVEHERDFIEGDAALASFERAAGVMAATENRGSAIGFLREWLMEPGQPSYCALLGELGMGKTTTVKELTRQLGEERAAGAEVPQAIYLDLRFVRDLAVREPDLDAILEQILRLSWKGGGKARVPSVNEIHDAVAAGALIIFDGLDEVLVNLTETQGQMFTRQLYRALPPDSPKGKLLITCRTHYFRDMKHESSHFTTEGRDGVKTDTYRALVLLPFEVEQIQQYLINSLGEADGLRAYEFLQTVHNLPELSQRPYTLSLIRQQFGKLEREKAEGRRVTGLTLYRFFVEEWLLRDSGKHQLIPEHKQRLMENIAADLVRQKQRSWAAGQLEDWLLEFLAQDAKMSRRYFLDTGSSLREREARQVLLMEDLRTATFLVREGDQFRFAHTSLQEYFLACYLRRALVEDAPERWALPRVSRETLDFLGQSLAESEIGPLKRLRDQYVPLASELAFEYFLVASAGGHARVNGAGFQLPGIDLREREIAEVELPGICLTGAKLRKSVWRKCGLRGAKMAGVEALQAEFHACRLDEADFGDANLTAAVFRNCGVRSVNWEAACEYGAHLTGCLPARRGGGASGGGPVEGADGPYR